MGDLTTVAAAAGASVRPTTSADIAVPLLHTVERAAQRLNVGRTMVFDLLASGQLESVKVGRLRRVPEAALVDYVERLRMAGKSRTAAA